MKMSSVDRILLREIYRSRKGIYMFNFYKKFDILPEQLVSFIKKYEKLKMIYVKDDKIFITDNGRKKIFANKTLNVRRNRNEIFKKIPEEFLQPKIKINSFYLADIEYLIN